MASVREYAILYVGGGKPGGAGGVIGGGSAITATPQHALDGFEHTAATTDPTRLDATSARHGLLPALSGDVGDLFRGDGTWGVGGGFVPTRIVAGATFTVPTDCQALFALPITVEGTLVVDGALVEVT